MIGEQIEVMLTESGYSDVYPGWYGAWIPLEIVEDHADFYLCEVLPHINPMNKGFKVFSKPYKITLHKFDIGRKFKVKGGVFGNG